MKSRSIIICCTIITMLPFLFACSSSSQLPLSQEPTAHYEISQVDVSYSGAGKDIDISAVGSSLIVTLWSHPSSGVRWELIEISNPTVLEQVDHQFEVSDKGIGWWKKVGGPGKEIWTFNALDDGESNITLKYREIRENGKTIETLVLTVIAK